MLNLWQWLRGSVKIQIISGDIDRSIRLAMDAGVIFHNALRKDELVMEATVSPGHLARLEKVLPPQGDEIRCIRKIGIRWQIGKLKRRPVLVAGIAALIALSLWLPGKVLFIYVTGNDQVPDRRILETAAKCGIYFGADREAVRSERMKNALLEVMPELQWAGINTAGCVAVITVREREEEPEQENNGHTVSSIIAVRDGIIDSCTVEKGTALCKPGQSVIKGQKLISGYTDCGITIRAEAAEGEIYALTERKLTVCSLANCLIRQENFRTSKKVSLKIGKKRINFYKGSGISPATCDRIYEEKYITLPGGFVLPVAIVTEVFIDYNCTDGPSGLSDTILSDFAEDYLTGQMVGGQILSESESTQTGSSILSMEGVYRCREMIGRVMKEEIIKPNEYDK